LPSIESPATPVQGVVVAVLVDFKPQHRAWGWSRLVKGPSVLKGQAGMVFAKVMGSGHEGGFSLRPSSSHQGLIAVLDNLSHARDFLNSELVCAYREHAHSCCQALMSVQSSRGEWDTLPWVTTPEACLEGAYGLEAPETPNLVAALTRASIRPASAMAFWKYAPAAQDQLPQADGCELAMGLGEAPLVRQCTFSVWRNWEAMHLYARRGAHQRAIEAAHRHSFFSESMFTRMRVLELHGQWQQRQYAFSAAPISHD